MAAAERAAMGRDSSTGSGAQMGLPPMFPGSGGARRSSNGSDRTALQCRALVPANNRQRSDPGYLIENGDMGIAWGLGAMAGLGQLVSYPQQMQMPPNQQQQIRRPSDNGAGGSSRIINLPKRYAACQSCCDVRCVPKPLCCGRFATNGQRKQSI